MRRWRSLQLYERALETDASLPRVICRHLARGHSHRDPQRVNALRRAVPLTVSCVLFLLAPVARAAEGQAEPAPPRPISPVALELNPLAVLVHRYRGQALLGLAGPASL